MTNLDDYSTGYYKTATTDEIAQKIIDFKKLEAECKAARYELESEIMSRNNFTDKEGSFTQKTNLFKTTETHKVKRDVDEKALGQLKDQFPQDLFPFKTKHSLDTKMYRAIETARPDLFELLEKIIIEKETKPSFKIEVLKNDC